MKQYTAITLVFLFFSSSLLAVFSAFERITPTKENPHDHHPKVELKKIEKNEYLLTVSKAKGHAWLIVCEKEREVYERELRGVIWKYPNAKTDDIEHISEVEISDKRIVEFRISEDIISRCYIAMDFRTPVFDGGYYYTIDIPEFYRHLKTRANQARETTP